MEKARGSEIRMGALAPGHHLDMQNIRTGDESLIKVTEVLKQGKVHLLGWVSHAILQITSAGFYGIQHPFKILM